MLQLRHLKTFLAAAETLSFTRAAERVNLSQPSVTEQIRALEGSVRQPLFVRSNNRLALTEAGRRLAARARELLAMADDTLLAAREGTDEAAGAVAAAAPQTLCARVLAPAMAAMAREGAGPLVAMHERNSKATVQAVVDGTADLGLLHGWPAADARVHAQLLARDAPVVVMPQGHALAGSAQVAPSRLGAFPLVATPAGCRYRDYLDTLVQHADTRATIRAEADSVPSLLRLVADGVGVAVLPRLAADRDARALRLELRALRGAGDGLPVCLVTPAARPMRDAAARLAGHIRDAVAGSGQLVSAFDVQDRARGEAVAH